MFFSVEQKVDCVLIERFNIRSTGTAPFSAQALVELNMYSKKRQTISHKHLLA